MSLATLSGSTQTGITVTRCRVSVPAHGIWWADVECASADVLTGSVTLVIEDLTLRGTILSGGAIDVRTRYRIVGGAGGWGRTLPAKSYANGFGIKKALVVSNAAVECGETVGDVPAGIIANDAYLHACDSFVRTEGPASNVLNELFPRGWYVDEAGVTQVGQRPSTTYKGGAPRTGGDASRGTIELAPSSLAGLLPGVIVDGVTAVDVEHVLDAKKLRTTIWGRRPDRDGDPVVGSIRRIVDSSTAHMKYFAVWEYRVVLRHVDRYDLQCTRASSGLPDLLSVRVRPGVAGIHAKPKLGSIVTVRFINGEPSRPFIDSCDDVEAPGDMGVAEEIVLQAGSTGTEPTEHATSAQAMVLAFQTWIDALGSAITAAGGAAAYLGAAVSALATDAAMATVIATLNSESIGTLTKAAIAASLTAKTADEDADAPGLGWPKVKGG